MLPSRDRIRLYSITFDTISSKKESHYCSLYTFNIIFFLGSMGYIVFNTVNDHNSRIMCNLV